MKKEKIFSNILKRLEEIRVILELSEKEMKLLSSPKQVSRAKINYQGKNYFAWRVLFNDALGPGKGGIRFHPQVSEDEVKSLAFWMMIKNSLAGLPYGGAKGGIRFNPKRVSQKGLETISRKYIDKFYKVLGENKDIPAPDVYTNSQIMAWMLDEYEKKIGYHQPGMITGKPLELGGCILRKEATAKGGFIIIKELVRKFWQSKRKPEVAIQGFGNAGSYLASMLAKSNFKIIALSDSKGGIYDKNGLKIHKVIEVKSKTKRVDGYLSAVKITNEKLLELPVDILVLAALENQITRKNVAKVKAKFIVEIANGPVSYQADKILFKKGIKVIPDVLANAGGVIVSYFEWAQNKTGNILNRKYLEDLLEKKMKTSWQNVLKVYSEYHKKIDLRTSAYLLAIKRILTAEKLRGNL